MAGRKAPLLNPPEPDTAVLRIALVSASPLVLAGLRAGLGSFAACEVVLASASLGEARRHGLGQADVLVIDGDDQLPQTLFDERDDGGPAIVLLADFDDHPAGAGTRAADLADWLARGVSVLARDAPPERVGAAALAAGAGLVASSPTLAASALRFARAGAAARPDPDIEPLTPREREVLEQMVQGLGNKAIAQALQVSPHTAKFHVAQIIAKLNASTRAHAVAKALQAGMLAG